MIKVYFPSRPAQQPAQPTDGESRTAPAENEREQRHTATAALPVVPEVVLARHGARVLQPSEAVRISGTPPPHPTVYRSSVLLIPNDVLFGERLRQRQDEGEGAARSPTDDGVLADLNDILADLGVELETPPPLDQVVVSRFVRTEAFQVLPRSVEIKVREGATAKPIDAWTVLQTLRAATAGEGDRTFGTADEIARLAEVVSQISLDHLLVGSALDGAGGALLVGANTASHGSPDLSDLFSWPRAGTSGRIPVTVPLKEPPRPGPTDERRVVVAVLDSGIADHPWLLPRVELGEEGQADAVVIVDPVVQEGMKQDARDSITAPRLPIDGYLDRPFIEEPLLGELSSHAGHGHFIAGIIRQVAPAAQVLAIRVMHPDGFAHEADVLFALTHIAANAELLAGDPPSAGQPVDVVSLSLGYFHESAAEVNVTTNLEKVLKRLTKLGVTVVAAAGNFSTSREFYPAALADGSTECKADSAPLISVGALNPDTTTARFSNEAPWVTCYASGVAIVSTFPAISGSLNPVAGVGRRRTLDPDNYAGGMAVWSGSSFAAPVVAGCLAERLRIDPAQKRVDLAWCALDEVKNDTAIIVHDESNTTANGSGP